MSHWDSRVVGANHDRIPTGDRAYGEGRIFVGGNKGGPCGSGGRLPVPTARVLPAICHWEAQGQKDIDLVVAVVRVAQPGNDTARSALRCTGTVVPGMDRTDATRRYQPHLQPLLAVPPQVRYQSVTGWMDQDAARQSSCYCVAAVLQELPPNHDRPSWLLQQTSKPCSASVEPSCGP